MCTEEAQKSLSNQGPDFIRRYKWFSPNHDFITQRVCDGGFNNSKAKPERYEEILAFEFTPESVKSFSIENEKEWKLDRRKVHSIQVLAVKEDDRSIK